MPSVFWGNPDSVKDVEIDPVSAKLAATGSAPARRHGSHGRKVREFPLHPRARARTILAPVTASFIPPPTRPSPSSGAHISALLLPTRQDHGVFAQHSKFGTFEVPKTFLNNNKQAAKCALKVADKMADRYLAKMAAKKAAKKAAAAKQMSTKAAADKKIMSQLAAPSKAERAPPSKSAKATAAVQI